jgi:mxaJ protein
MGSSLRRDRGRPCPAWLALCLVMLANVGAAAQTEAPARTAFKVCQDPNNLPFSNEAGQGIENKLAELFARDLGLPVAYYSFPQRMAFIRNTLRFKLPGEEYPCDVVMGVPAGFDQVSVTQPYYRSAYAMVVPVGRGLDAVSTANDLLSLPRDKLKRLRIGVFDRSPASLWLAHHDLVDQGVPYPMLSPDPAQYPGEIIERDLAAGKIDVAIVWGPIAGYYAKRVSKPALRVLVMNSEKGVKFDYAMAMGVRYGEPEWKKQIESLIVKHHAAILAILQDYGVPLLELEASPPAR